MDKIRRSVKETMNEIIELKKVMFDKRANNGIWCKAHYPNHPLGCPNFPNCIEKNQLKYCSPNSLKWYAVIEEFDLETHANKMKKNHPNWTNKQCRCILYWQNSVRKKLKEKAEKACLKLNGFVVTLIPEALGINVFGTMAKVGIILYKNPKIVKKIAFVGVKEK